MVNVNIFWLRFPLATAFHPEQLRHVSYLVNGLPNATRYCIYHPSSESDHTEITTCNWGNDARSNPAAHSANAVPVCLPPECLLFQRMLPRPSAISHTVRYHPTSPTPGYGFRKISGDIHHPPYRDTIRFTCDYHTFPQQGGDLPICFGKRLYRIRKPAILLPHLSASQGHCPKPPHGGNGGAFCPAAGSPLPRMRGNNGMDPKTMDGGPGIEYI